MISKITAPWLLAGATIALTMAGASGMYAGYEIANGRHAAAVSDLKDAHIQALQARTDQYLEAIKRGDQVAEDFFGALREMKIVNTTINQEVVKEIEKLVYTDCRLPDSGADLLQRKVDAANMQLLGKGKK